MQLTEESKSISRYMFSKIWKCTLVVLVTVLTMCNLKGCKDGCIHETIQSDNTLQLKFDSLKTASAAKEDTIAVLKTQVAMFDSINKILKPNYRKAKTDNRNFIANNPCDSIGILSAYDLMVSKADTIILVDSLEIMALKKTNDTYSNIISDKVSMLQNKEEQLKESKIELSIEQKKVKVQKRRKIAAICLGALSVIATIFILK